MAGEEAARTDAQVKAGLSDTTEGTCEGYDWPNRLVLVNIGGTVIPMPWMGTSPWKGDRVRVILAGQKPICQSVYGSAMGTIQVVTSSIAQVLGDDGVVYQYPIAFGDSLSAGNRVRLDHAGQLVVRRYAAEPLVAQYTVPSAPGAGSGAQTFRPKDSGNFRLGTFMGQDVQVNVNRTGVYWYGTQIADSIPDTATITRAEIRLVETADNLPGVPSMLGTHNQASRGSEPTISGVIPVTGSGTVSILGAIANALKTGAGLGVGFQLDTGYRIFAPYDQSGSIYMEWR